MGFSKQKQKIPTKEENIVTQTNGFETTNIFLEKR